MSLAVEILNRYRAEERMITTAESCTGGLLAAALTHRPGSSKIFDRGFVTYSNEAKTTSLNVPPELLEQHGAVSPEVAQAMAQGALENSLADLTVSITGVAGPDGGSEAKPVGLVYFGYALKNGSSGSIKANFDGNREEVRGQAANLALKQMLAVLEEG